MMISDGSSDSMIGGRVESAECKDRDLGLVFLKCTTDLFGCEL